MISLRKVTNENFRACVKLNPGEEQKDYVAPNLYSIAEAYVNDNFIPRAIYADDTLVGFVMYGRDHDTGDDWIIRFMIDEQYQRKGYGRAGMLATIDEIKQLEGVKDIRLDYVDRNVGAEKLYTGLGFVPTGEVEEGRDGTKLIVLHLPIS